MDTINRCGKGRPPLAAALVLLTAVTAAGREGPVTTTSEAPDRPNGNVRYEQRLGEKVPLDLTFVNEDGNPVTLGECVGGKPTILILAYYRCPMLCGEVLAGVLDSMRRMGSDFTCGKDFNVVAVSFDPKEKPPLALAKKRHFVTEYGRKEADQGWRFLTGQKPEIDRLTAAVGFQYEFDKMLKEYDHPSGIVVLTPTGTISQYFAGIDYPPGELREALQTVAGQERVGPKDLRDFFSCYRYNPHTGKYSANVMGIVRTSGVLTLLLLAGLYAWKSWRVPGVRVMVVGIVAYLMFVPVILFAQMPRLAFVGVFALLTVGVIIVGRVVWRAAKARQAQVPPLAGAGVE